jgi:hypothetical protein
MFDSIEQQIKHDEEGTYSPTERRLRWVVGAAIVVVVFGCLYYGVRLLG